MVFNTIMVMFCFCLVREQRMLFEPLIITSALSCFVGCLFPRCCRLTWLYLMD
ncbi:hypothetical protein M8C21_014677 [Ambrosia artemisiifolia]|uniref:Uncharacterized protein n=1 Tax=Ambrosia artemisiifolia TaxID=4212 RepID=A0AAD5C5Q2_AMBAR|nr:hypothetical protein M8C21_014677 [Ambrosia artemisiifolia]